MKKKSKLRENNKRTEREWTDWDLEDARECFNKGVPLSKAASKLKRRKESLRKLYSDFFWEQQQYNTYELLVRRDIDEVWSRGTLSYPLTESQAFILHALWKGWSIPDIVEHIMESPKPFLYHPEDLEKSNEHVPSEKRFND
jgi:hypothetical protein